MDGSGGWNWPLGNTNWLVYDRNWSLIWWIDIRISDLMNLLASVLLPGVEGKEEGSRLHRGHRDELVDVPRSSPAQAHGLPFLVCACPTRSAWSPSCPAAEGRDVFFPFLSPDTWDLDVIEMTKNWSCTKHFSESQIHGGATPQWSCVDLQLWSCFFRAGALPNTP
jgi:hypothetical protein